MGSTQCQQVMHIILGWGCRQAVNCLPDTVRQRRYRCRLPQLRQTKFKIGISSCSLWMKGYFLRGINRSPSTFPHEPARQGLIFDPFKLFSYVHSGLACTIKMKQNKKQKAPVLPFSPHHKLHCCSQIFKAKDQHQLFTFKTDLEVLSSH